jgi:RNA polymerase sigma-70 factor, ECF subfamily
MSRDDAPDLVQEVFAVVTLHIDGFHRDRPGDSFGAWLRTVARNVVRGYFRSRNGEPVAQGGTDAQQPLGMTIEAVY